jgi:hypothetical protein
MEELKTNKKFMFVILDGKCFVEEGRTTGDTDEGFLTEAMLSIKDLENSTQRAIPFCVNTGYIDELRNAQRRSKVFSKGKDEDEMFRYIWSECNKSEELQVRYRYPEIFEFADAFFSQDNLKNLLHLLSKEAFLKRDTPMMEGNLTKLRKLNEHLMDIFAEQYFGKKPMEIADNGGKRTVQIVDYIHANDSIPRYLLDMIKLIYYTCSSHGSHNPTGENRVDWKPTANAVASMTYGLLETIVWMKAKISA